MRKLITVAITLCICFLAAAQGAGAVDSLKTVLSKTSTDTDRVWAMHAISFNTMYAQQDTSIHYAQEALALSRKIVYKRGEIRSQLDVANCLTNVGNYLKGLELEMEALQDAEKINDLQLQAAALGNISETYSSQGDQVQAVAYTRRSLKIDLANRDTLFMLFDYLNLGDYFFKNQQPDSALLYGNQAYQINLRLKRTDLMAGILMSQGDIQAELGNNAISLAMLKDGLSLSEKTLNATFVSRSCLSISNLFNHTGNKDSAMYYLKRSYASAQEGDYSLGKLEAAQRLTAMYENTNNDSCFKYMKLTLAFKDSLFRQEKVKQLQNVTYSEQLRQQEIAELRAAASEERRHNLQLLAIGAFIPAFFGVVLLLSRRRVRPRTIEFFGILGLLLLFEFIALFIHPYITKWTNNTPVLMLLILVAIAALLVPTHHRLERWVKERLARKSSSSLRSSE